MLKANSVVKLRKQLNIKSEVEGAVKKLIT